MDQTAAIESLGALAHSIRLEAFRALIAAGPQGLTPSALIEMLEVPSAKLSFHLKELAISGLVTQEHAGRNIIYRAAYDRMDALLAYLTENCCQGAGCATSAAAACSC
jgi:DNA-binding transcriptional ArsR family regulator